MKNRPKKIDCLGMGIIPFDLLYTVKTYPKAGMKIDGESFIMQGGGPVPNVCVGLARMGFSSALLAPVGNDPFGKLMLKELHQDNVNTDWMLIKRQPTAIATGWIEKKTGNRTMVLNREIMVRPADIVLNELPNAHVVHLDGRDMPATMKLARWAKRNNILVSLDIGSMRNDVSEVFPLVDQLVVADAYALPFTKTTSAVKAIERLRIYCPGTIVVTEGVKGSVGQAADNNKIVRQKAFKVHAVDTTGAGDCYHTGYLYSLLKGYSLADCMLFGSASAAIKCTRPGARTGIPTEHQLRQFLKKKPEMY